MAAEPTGPGRSATFLGQVVYHEQRFQHLPARQSDLIRSEGHGYRELLKVATPYLALTLTYASGVLVVEELLGDKFYKNVGQIGSVFGIAVALFLGFRMNSAYDRWWEARKVMGELNNTATSFACKICVYFRNPANLEANHQPHCGNITEDLVGLTRLYVEALKVELLDEPQVALNELGKRYELNAEHKLTNEIMLAMARRIEGTFAASRPIEKSDLMQHVNRLIDIQGRAERIKSTPFLMIYSAFTRLIVLLYVLLIPFFLGDIDLGGEASHWEYLALPITASIGSIFLTIHKLANLYGTPFATDSATSLPVVEICQGIDRRCAQMLESKSGLAPQQSPLNQG